MKTTMSAKKSIVFLMTVLMSIALILSLTACKEEVTPEESLGIWADAVYTEDVTLGEGAKNFYFEVKVGEHSVTFTINTDKETVGDALLEHGIIAGDEGPYGLYVKTVNGIHADYDNDSAYWAFHKNGELASTGVDGEKIDNGAVYEMVYTKG